MGNGHRELHLVCVLPDALFSLHTTPTPPSSLSCRTMHCDDDLYLPSMTSFKLAVRMITKVFIPEHSCLLSTPQLQFVLFVSVHSGCLS
jgi:hypothetical protein